MKKRMALFCTFLFLVTALAPAAPPGRRRRSPL